jgi:hypothetical protein
MVHQAKRNIRSSQISNTTYRPKSTVNKVMLYLYILVDPDKKDRCKVGITRNVYERIKAYRTAAPNCKFANVYNIPASYHERRILDLLRDIAIVQSEYVHLDHEMVAKVVEGYLKDNNL